MSIRSIVFAVAAATAAAASLSAQDHVHPAAQREARDLGEVRREHIRLSTGVELDVAQAGPPDGTPVLFLHGFADSWFSFSPMLDRLPPGMRAIVPTQRGHGDSERPFCCYGVSDFAADAVALLDALGIERAALVGHSMGSFVAQRVAIDWPERVDRLVLVGSGASPATKAVVGLNEEVQGLVDPISPDFVREFQVSMLSAPLPAGLLAGFIAESGKLPARVWRDALGGLVVGSAEDELFRIAAPTLVVWGADDPVFLREDQERLVSAIPGAQLAVYDDTGHSPNWERPDRFAGDLREFLQPEGHVRRDRVRLSTEVRAALPIDLFQGQQLQKCFVDHVGRRQRVIGAFAAQPPARDPSELIIDPRQEALHGACFTRSVRAQQEGDVRWAVSHEITYESHERDQRPAVVLMLFHAPMLRKHRRAWDAAERSPRLTGTIPGPSHRRHPGARWIFSRRKEVELVITILRTS